jgi:demethylmenaquinone methyltransferase/2-methoxy-6-polyprenyl-1,4-benzoquinol methylase
MKAREYRGPDSHSVQQMFAGIAHRYDFLNHFLSASADRRWRNVAVRKILELVGSSPSAPCLDVCSGTGDLAIALHQGLKANVVGTDFCHPMLTRANSKIAAADAARAIRNIEADTLNLPFVDGSFSAVAIAFGLRNLEDPARGLMEMHRVLAPGGALAVLEFSKPVVPVFRQVFNFYFRYILPKLGAAISGNGSAYQYLPDSVRKFPAQAELVELMRAVGFREVDYQNLSGGIAALHWGRKAGSLGA